MNSIFIGMIFIFLDFNLTFNNVIVGLIPDFIGYIYIYKGAKELSVYSERFEETYTYIVVMGIYSAVVYLLRLTGITASLGMPITYILNLIVCIMSLVISYKIVQGIADIEIVTSSELNYEKLNSSWKILAVFSIAACVLSIIPGINIFCAIVSFVAGVYYLFVFNTSKRLFNENL